MDSDSHDSTLTSISSNEENEDSTMIKSTSVEFFKTYQRQNYSLPDSIMFYIMKNPPTPEIYEIMIEICKDFFVKNPILVFSDLDYEDDGWSVNEKRINLDNLTCKFWITSGFRVGTDYSFGKKAVNENIASSVTSKIFRCDAKNLTLVDQILSFDDLSHIISNVEVIYLDNITVKENDGSIVVTEKIVEVSVKAKRITIYNPFVTSKTMQELIKIPNFCQLDFLCINYLPETFDIEAFYVYMKKNQHTDFMIDFDDFISDAYKNRLEEILDEIIAPETPGYKLPFLTFPRMPEEKENELFRIRFNIIKL